MLNFISLSLLSLCNKYTKVSKNNFSYEFERPGLATDCVIFGFDGCLMKSISWVPLPFVTRTRK